MRAISNKWDRAAMYSWAYPVPTPSRGRTVVYCVSVLPSPIGTDAGVPPGTFPVCADRREALVTQVREDRLPTNLPTHTTRGEGPQAVPAQPALDLDESIALPVADLGLDASIAALSRYGAIGSSEGDMYTGDRQDADLVRATAAPVPTHGLAAQGSCVSAYPDTSPGQAVS